MKKLFTPYLLMALTLCLGHIGYAQEFNPDQNPNYRQSMYRYLAVGDSITRTQSTTFQDTYKAYDWYEARQERRDLRRERRYNIRMERAKYGSYYDSYPGYYYSGYSGYSRYRNNWNIWPSIGFRTGNWWFSI